MNRNSYNLDGSHKHAGYQKPRWRSVFIALLLALVLGSASQMPLAQAAPASATDVGFFMLALKEGASKPVCKGELVHLNVLVYRQKMINGVSAAPEPITGLSVIGVVDNPDIGKISPDENTTIWASAIYPGAADFVFTAENYGETIVAFAATIENPGWVGANGGVSQTVSAQLDIRVVPCKFKVVTIGEWHIPGEANISIVALSDDAEVTAPNAQSTYTGSASVDWIASGDRVLDCVGQFTMGSSQVDWTGRMNDSGQLVLDGTWQQVAGSINNTCTNSEGTISGSFQLQLKPDPANVSATSSGGVYRQSQNLQFDGANPGYVTIIVVPDEDKSMVFDANNWAFLSPSSWLAVVWDNFPGSYSDLLALR